MGGGGYEKTLYATVLLCTIQRTLPCECLLLVRMTKSAIRATNTILNSDSRKKAFTARSQLRILLLRIPLPKKQKSLLYLRCWSRVILLLCVTKRVLLFFHPLHSPSPALCYTHAAAAAKPQPAFTKLCRDTLSFSVGVLFVHSCTHKT